MLMSTSNFPKLKITGQCPDVEISSNDLGDDLLQLK